MLLITGLPGIAINANRLLPTYEYEEYAMREGPELTYDNDNQGNAGLKLDYATVWFYGIGETPNLLMPNFNGGASAGELSKNSNTYKLLKANYSNANSLIKQMPLYWGPHSFTASLIYMGAISIFLFVLGLFVIKGRYKWWIVGVSLSAVSSRGETILCGFPNYFSNMRLYTKFRTVSMILQITIPVLAILGLNEVLYNIKDKNEKR